jgi:hypothetical protein
MQFSRDQLKVILYALEIVQGVQKRMATEKITESDFQMAEIYLNKQLEFQKLIEQIKIEIKI